MDRFVQLVLFFWAVTVSQGLTATDYFKVCKKSEPDVEQCILTTLDNLRPLLKKGSKDLKIPSVEPMLVPRVQVQQGSGSVSIDSTFIDLKVHGISNYKVKKAKVDFKKGIMEFNIDVPYLYMAGDYEIRGRVLALPIVGKGDSWGNYTGVSGIMTLKMAPIEKSGVTFMQLEKLSFDIKVQKAQINMNNLFNGNKELGDAMNNFMSSNWEVVFQELKPVVDSAISAILENIASKIFSKFPASQLFPE